METIYKKMITFFRKATGFMRAHLAASVSIACAAVVLIGSLSAVIIIKSRKSAEPVIKKEPIKNVSSEAISSEEQPESELPSSSETASVAVPQPQPIKDALKSSKYKAQPKEDPQKQTRPVTEDETPSSSLTRIINSEQQFDIKEVSVVTVSEERPVYKTANKEDVSTYILEKEKVYDYISTETIEIKKEDESSSEISSSEVSENPESSENTENSDISGGGESELPENTQLVFYKVKYDSTTYENKELGGETFEGYVLAEENIVVKKDDYKRKFPIEVALPDGRIFKEGFNTVDGKTYYVHGGKFVTGYAEINGIRYHFDPVTGVKDCEVGIDVSSHQGSIDWAKVKKAGIEFAYIRIGYRGYETGRLCIDSCFEKNLRDAQKYGIKCGVYFYSVAVNEAEAIEEANLVLGALSGKGLQLPVYCDIEHVGDRVTGLNKTQRTNNALAFVNTIRAGGFSAGIYTYFNYYNNYLEGSRVANESIWIAYYTEEASKVKGIPYIAWQYTSKGSVSGINGRVDMNLRKI